jgi:integrase
MPRVKKQHLKRRKDGRFACRYKNLWFYGDTEEEALGQREEYKQLEKSGELDRQRTLFSAYAVHWLKAYKSHLTAGPYNTHARILTRWLDSVGDRPLTEYAPSDVSGFYQLYAGMSASSIHSARDTIKGVFKAAVADGIIDKSPAESITPPKGTKGTHRAITAEERQLIHQVDHRLRPAVMSMLYAGLRRGEAMAINIPRDVNFTAKTITVREAVRFGRDGKPMICRPKTEAGIRTVPLLDILAAELQNIPGLLCVSAENELMTESAWKRAWSSYLYALGEAKNGCSKRWAKSAWVPVDIRAHDLRHSYCTMLYDFGIDLKTAMLWMGHADQTMTMQIYTHLTEQRRTEAENTLRNAEKQAFGSQNGSQDSMFHVEPLKILDSSNDAH